MLSIFNHPAGYTQEEIEYKNLLWYEILACEFVSDYFINARLPRVPHLILCINVLTM
jgi:hypothetical protein